MPPMLASPIANSLRSALDQEAGPSIVDDPRCTPEPRDHSFRDDLNTWFRVNGREFPWRQSALTPWQFLMIEMCLHRTKAEQVAKVAAELLKLGRTPESYLDNLETLEPLVASLGLRWRSHNLIAAATFVKEKLGGRVPDNWQELVAIPGVGDYIASVVLCFAFGRPSILMDTNTIRIARRVLGVAARPTWRLRISLHRLAEPEGADPKWNQALLDLGGLICTARAPKCGPCPVRSHCVTGTNGDISNR